MTNALRKAPQHTAVGFKQTVSGERAGHPWVGSETPRGWDLTGLVGPSGMPGPMEFGLGTPMLRSFWDVRSNGV